MRRSKAPSMLSKAKRQVDSKHPREEKHLDSGDEQYTWGSRNDKKCIENKRIFHVVWREATKRKHKIWKGDGTLEVGNFPVKVILKDESGKYMGSSTNVNINSLVPDYQMTIAAKEVEIQSEIINEEELHKLRKRQVEFSNWDRDECCSIGTNFEEGNKLKGAFKFKPVLVLNSPKKMPAIEQNFENENLNLDSEWESREAQHQHSEAETFKEFLCFLRPSELQQFLFQKVFEYSSSLKNYNEGIEHDIKNVLKLICNHPSLINHKTTTNELLHHLMPYLPDWTEMGPFDSSKLEFVQYFLTDLTKSSPQTCIIFAKGLNVLNMLQGLCDFMKIKCLRLNASTMQNMEAQVLKFCLTGGDVAQVLLISSLETLSSINFFTYIKKLIAFEEYLEISNVGALESCKNLTTYNLITAYSIEELLLLNTYNNEGVGSLINDITDIVNNEPDCCYLHTKIECNCFRNSDEILNTESKFIKNWKHFKPPFDEQILKISSLENSSENLVSLFCKKFN